MNTEVQSTQSPLAAAHAALGSVISAVQQEVGVAGEVKTHLVGNLAEMRSLTRAHLDALKDHLNTVDKDLTERCNELERQIHAQFDEHGKVMQDLIGQEEVPQEQEPEQEQP